MLIRPERPKVFIKKLNKELRLDFVTIADEEWIRERYPNNSYLNNLRDGSVDTALDMFWHFIDDDSKKIVASSTIKKWEGMKEVEVQVDDPIEKLKYIVSGADEMKSILEALFTNGERSNPVPEETEKKKKLAGSL